MEGRDIEEREGGGTCYMKRKVCTKWNVTLKEAVQRVVWLNLTSFPQEER